VTLDSESMESIGGMVPGLKGLLSIVLYVMGSFKGYQQVVHWEGSNR
jgi:hypothetical protein